MEKIYILDTNVLIQAPYAVECFEENEVVLPMTVLEELDNLKKEEGEKGANVRRVIRILDAYREKGNLLEGVYTGHGGILRVEKNYLNVELPEDLPDHKSDNRILKVCIGLSKESPKQVILVTKDILLRIKAQLLGIQAEDFTTEQVAGHEEQYLGRKEVFVPEVLFKDFKKKGVPVESVYCCDSNGACIHPELFENEFIILRADQSSKKTQLGRVEKGIIRKLEYRKSTPYGVSPRNVGQYFFQEALMQPAEKAPLVIVKGMAGTSKTFYSLAVGLEKVLNDPSGEYRRILICRPNALFDSDIGFLPGNEQEKISPLMRPIMDNLEQLVDSNDRERYSDERELQDKIQEIFDRGLIQTEALTFIRGRSILKTYLIIDEAQNMTPGADQGNHYPCRKRNKDHSPGRSQSDRPSLSGRQDQWAQLCGGAHERKSIMLADHSFAGGV